MMKIGRLCVKIAGRDADKKCVIVDVLGDNMVMIDGQTRRRKCNVKHLEPLETKIDIKKGADHNAIVEEFKILKIPVLERKSKERKEKPKKQRKSTMKEKKPKKEKKKTAKAEIKKEKKEENTEKKTDKKDEKTDKKDKKQ